MLGPHDGSSGVGRAHAPNTPSAIRTALAENGLAPLHRLGQHFLADPRLCERIARSLDDLPGRPCLEVGPGLGALTAALLHGGRHVLAVELDRGLSAYLRSLTEADDALTVVEGDARLVDFAALVSPAQTVLVGNLPYYASSPLLRRAFALPFPAVLVMLQREVAERLAAPPQTPLRGALSVLREAVCTVDRVLTVAAGAFYPRPEVESVVVRLDRRPDAFEGARYHRLEAVLAAGFRYRRKGMRQALRHGTTLGAAAVEQALAAAAIDGHRRPESLTLEEWDRVAAAVDREGGSTPWLLAAPAGS